MLQIDYVCTTDIGRVRSVNQDNYICNGRCAPPDETDGKASFTGSALLGKPMLFGVFDGVGGEERGELAAYIAALSASEARFNGDAVSALGKYCIEANERICRYAKESSVAAMGTTAALLLFAKRNITLCNVGDSRIYRYSGGAIQQISKDHAVAAPHGKKPLLYQSLGIPAEKMIIEPYFSQGRCVAGDRYLICSDGLSDMVAVQEMSAALTEKRIDIAANRLMACALENGGRDNITLILLELNKIGIIDALKRKRRIDNGEMC